MKTRWNNWEYSPEYCTLTYKPYGYEIDLEKIHDSAAMLDWIFQLWHKEWGQQSMPDLLEAFDYLFQPQANLCSWGVGKKVKKPRELLARLSQPRPTSVLGKRPG